MFVFSRLAVTCFKTVRIRFTYTVYLKGDETTKILKILKKKMALGIAALIICAPALAYAIF
jgi:hypothetical protein